MRCNGASLNAGASVHIEPSEEPLFAGHVGLGLNAHQLRGRLAAQDNSDTLCGSTH